MVEEIYIDLLILLGDIHIKVVHSDTCFPMWKLLMYPIPTWTWNLFKYCHRNI